MNLLKKEKKLKYELLYGILLGVSTMSLIFPYGYPLVSIFIGLFFLYFLISNKISIHINAGVILLFILIFFYLFGMMITFGGISKLNLQDIISAIGIIVLITLSGNARSDSLKEITKYFFSTLTMIIPWLALFSLYKYSLLSNGVKLVFLESDGREYPLGSSLMPDYNMFALGMTIGIIGVFYITLLTKSKFIQFYCIGSIILMSYSIYLSGSRRGIVVLGIVLIYVLVMFIKKVISNSVKNNLLLTVTSVLIAVFFMLNADTNSFFENQTVELEKIKYRYSTLNNVENAFSTRQDRWDYGFELIRDFNAHNYFTGAGFEYLEQYGLKFNTDSGLDYPHNIFMSAFLYSGLIGVLCLMLIFLLPFIRYIKSKSLFPKEILFIYLLNLLFLVISGNSFLSVSIMWLILTLLTTIRFNPQKTIITKEAG